MTLDAAATVDAPEVRIQARSSAATIGDSIALRAPAIHLGGAGARGAGDAASAAQHAGAPQRWRVRVCDAAADASGAPVPAAGRRFIVTDHGPEPFHGTTDGDGVLEFPIVYPRCRALVTMEDRVFWLTLSETLPEDSRADRRRLRNLGFGTADANAWTRAELRDAVQAFQRAANLDATGELDAATRQRLIATHGS